MKIFRKLKSQIRFLIEEKENRTYTIQQKRSLARHEAHRIEKSYYNNIYIPNKEVYNAKALRINKLLASHTDPADLWAKTIADNVGTLESSFINENSISDYTRPVSYPQMVNLQKHRRSVRVWDHERAKKIDWELTAQKLITSAIWAPHSGNRQAIRFLPLNTQEERSHLSKLKEQHTVNASLNIVCFADRSLYHAYGDGETSQYFDGAACVANMIHAAQALGLDTCWNHFAKDFIGSRSKNKLLYMKFCNRFKIPDSYEPLAILSIGIAAFIPPTPARMSTDDFIIKK